jgi:threonyl-tRNA synthetase
MQGVHTMSDHIFVRQGDQRVDVDADTTAIQALKALEAVRGQVVAATVNGVEWDLDRPVAEGAGADGEIVVDPIQADTEQGRAILRHSVAHLMAQAVTDL